MKKNIIYVLHSLKIEVNLLLSYLGGFLSVKINLQFTY